MNNCFTAWLRLLAWLCPTVAPRGSGGLQWQAVPAPLGMSLDSARRADPYLVWAEITDYAGFTKEGRLGTTPVLLEFAQACGSTPPSLRTLADRTDAGQALPVDLTTALKYAPWSRFQTAHVSIDNMAPLVRLVEAGCLVRFQLGLARGTPVKPVLESLAHPTTTTDGPLRTLGIIDDGCCFAHEAFRSASQESRLLFVWDQSPGSALSDPWKRYRGLTYGAELDRIDLTALLRQHPELGTDSERALYASIGRPAWGKAGRTHGAGVMHLMAGVRNAPERRPEGQPQAADMPVIFVQLPDDTVADSSGGSLGVYVIDGARYIVERTRRTSQNSNQADWWATINVSLGSIAGPHDGTTITEQALEELTRSNGKRVRIVVAAGNTANRQTHGQRTITPHRPGMFLVMAAPECERETYVEVWLPELDTVGRTIDASAFSIRVGTPQGGPTTTVMVGQVAALFDGRMLQAGVVFARHVAQGMHGTMVLLAIRPAVPKCETAGSTGPSGIWSIEVSCRHRTAVEVHAWVERNETIIGPKRPQQSRFIHDNQFNCENTYISKQYTLSSLANGIGVTVAGAYRVSDERVTAYSANGPTLNGRHRPSPDTYGPSDRSPSLKGVRMPGFFSGTRSTLSGTSAAAPRVARWIAEGEPVRDELPLRPADPGDSPSSPPVGIIQHREEDR